MKKIIRLTESDLHNIVKESVKRVLSEGWIGRGYVPSDGNSMVGGEYGRSELDGEADILNKFIEKVIEVTNTEESEPFIEYCEKNPDVFVVKGIIGSEYDESTGYGSAYSPMFTLEDVFGDKKALEYVAQYPDKRMAQLATKILNDVLNNLDSDDFEILERDY